MEYLLKNCRTGTEGIYKTRLDIREDKDNYLFTFVAENSRCYCPYSKYNAIHSEGDACEILIGSDPERKVYYEIEINPKGQLMVAKMIYRCVDGKPSLDMEFVDEKECFVVGETEQKENGYVARLCINKKAIYTGEGETFFNAYRLETDGGECLKHLFALNPTRYVFHMPEFYLSLKDYVTPQGE